MAVRSGSPPRATRLPRALVVSDLEPDDVNGGIDWSDWYLDDADGMGDWAEQDEITHVLLSSIGQLARQRGWTDFHVGTARPFAWIREEPLVRVSPDVYLLDYRPAPPIPTQWQTWISNHRPPRFALEIVSNDWRRDYEDIPSKYWQLGCPELVIFDPLGATHPLQSSERVLMQAYRRDSDGAYVRVHAGTGPVWSVALGSWLLITGDAEEARLRLAHGAASDDIIPTEEELLAAESQAREAAEARVKELQARVRELELEDEAGR